MPKLISFLLKNMKYLIALVVVIAGIWGLTYLNKDTDTVEITGTDTSMEDSTASIIDAMDSATTTEDAMMEKGDVMEKTDGAMKK